MKITIDLSSDEAETLVFACAMRAKQKGLSSTNIVAIGNQIALKAGKAFRWHEPEKMLARMMWRIKHVTIKGYDTNPNPQP